MILKLRRILRSQFLHSDRLRRSTPSWIKTALKRRIAYAEYRSEQLRREAEKRLGGPIPFESTYESPYNATLGVFFDNSYTFAFHVAACQDLRVRYKVIDLLAPDWVQRVRDSACDAFLASPPTLRGVWRRVFEERLWVVAYNMQKRLCPTFAELYLWESKRRMHDWLVAHAVPHPQTWVFVSEDEATEFVQRAEYPLVAKTDSGAAASGVWVLRDRKAAERHVRSVFSKGVLPRSADPREREQGYVIFQRYVPHDHEWRIVRIGDSFMCRRKKRVGDYASGSGAIQWARPSEALLEFSRKVTDLGSFRSMALDVFEQDSCHSEEPYLANELQTLFGAIEEESNTNEHTGRWFFSPEMREWQFAPGFFYQNACANLRVEHLLNAL